MPDRVPVLSPTPVGETLADGLDEHLAVASDARPLLPMLEAVVDLLTTRLAAGGRLLVFGNGGSAADAQHLAAELVGRFRRPRRPLPAIALTTDSSVLTAVANDFAWEEVFARQLRALATPSDVVVAFTTSGASANVVAGLATARAHGAATVLFAGLDGGLAKAHADVALVVPSASTARIQEVHGLFVHLLSDAVDAWAAATEGEEPGR